MAILRRSSTDSADVEILQDALVKLEAAKRHAAPKHEQMRRLHMAYLGRSHPDYGRVRRQDDLTDWRSRLFPPLALEQIETLNAELTQDDPEFQLEPDDWRYADDAVHAEQGLRLYTYRDKLPYKRNLADKIATVLGGCPVKVTYDTKPKQVKGYRPAPHAVGADPFNGSICHEGPTVSVRRPWDIFPAPNATDFQLDCAYLFDAYGMTLEQIRNARRPDGSPLYRNVDILAQGGPGMRERAGFRTESPEAQKARRMGMFQIHEMWTPGGMVVIGNESVVLRVEDTNPYGCIPYVMLKVIEDLDQLYGLSIVQIIEDMQESIWTLHNRFIDAVNLGVNPPLEFDADNNPKGGQQKIYPGARLPNLAGNGERSFAPIPITLDNGAISNAIQSLRQMMEQITGINAAIAGFDDSATATQAAINVRQGKGRIGAMMDVLDDGWARVAQQMLDIMLDFVGSEQQGSVGEGYDKKVVSFDPKKIRTGFTVRASESSERALKDLRRQDALNLTQSFQPVVQLIPSAMQLGIDLVPALKKLCEAFNLPFEQVVDQQKLAQAGKAQEQSGPMQKMLESMQLDFAKFPAEVQAQILPQILAQWGIQLQQAPDPSQFTVQGQPQQGGAAAPAAPPPDGHLPDFVPAQPGEQPVDAGGGAPTTGQVLAPVSAAAFGYGAPSANGS